MRIDKNSALIVVDVQRGFDRSIVWGRGNNPAAEVNIASLCEMWEATGRPIVCVRHTAEVISGAY